MIPLRPLILALGLIWPIAAATATEPAEPVLFHNAADVTLEEFAWVNRPVVVFADSPADPRFIHQMRVLNALPQELIDRDVVVITDTDPAAESAIRMTLRPRGFMLVLLGKDGQVKLRKPQPWDVRELTRVIDKDPQRQQEVEDRRDSK
ncbi:DUF4174 domain-containing protein [Pseudooceanicola sp.]|uniref:DUF4174 domain-containing protein n=1 Tax=Pseudooceanicola sp. TaxID=1914328 RepID=UPI00260FE1EF|nr:DUF4174 domain-containing protein [Pseudooceanicola sp.]MDF1853962.1 DUF4174 domain-containing protein [Pseudooceanicola sp.]